MAISHVQPLLLLLISLFFFSALGKIDFRPCDRHQFPVKVSDVEISPDPVNRSGNANITITGDTSKAIPDGVTVSLTLTKVFITVYSETYSLCDITACPVAPGPLVLTLPNVPMMKDEKRFKKNVAVISITEKAQKYMCVFFVAKSTRGYASLLSQVTG